MRILIINQYYHPDIAATAQLCADLGEDLARRGHRVTALAGTAAYRAPHDGERALPPARLGLRGEHRGVRIVRVPVPDSSTLAALAGPAALAGRAPGYLSFLGGAPRRVLSPGGPRVGLAPSTPPPLGGPGPGPPGVGGCCFGYWGGGVFPGPGPRPRGVGPPPRGPASTPSPRPGGTATTSPPAPGRRPSSSS